MSQASGHLEETKSGVLRPSPSRIRAWFEDEPLMRRKALLLRSRILAGSRYTSSTSIDASGAFLNPTEAIPRGPMVTELFMILLKNSDRRRCASHLRAA